MTAVYQVLARKWRPRSFNDMVGQDHIVRMLSNALEQQRLHHAYLFTGTRGVGKTTAARILAKCLNCETGITPNPCGTCHTCKAIDAGQFLDLYEVDAASRTKVEDTRDLLENVHYPPTQGRFKIYLIDEVHMLSNHSFNALLKTLEEPPAHVKFLLATTDPKRLPITILSRCLQFHLKRITASQIAAHLAHVCDSEKMAAETPALEQLAKAADGSMRDALSLLDQAIAYGHGSVKKIEVEAMLGTMAQDDILPLVKALATSDSKALFPAIKQLAERAPDFDQALDELISTLHQIAITQVAPDALNVSDEIKLLAKQISPEDVQLYYQIGLLGKRDLPYAPTPELGFEMTLVRMLAFKPVTTQSQSTVVTDPVKKAVPAKTAPAQASTPSPAAQPTVAASASLAEWRDILPKLELAGMAYALASNCTLQAIDGNKVTLTLSAQHEPMLNPKLKDRIAESISRVLGKTVTLNIEITTEAIVTPVKMDQEEHQSKLAQAKQTLLSDPKVKQLIEMYDATLEVALI